MEVDERILTEAAAGDDPVALFASWFETARTSGVPLPEAMTLATATPDAGPAVGADAGADAGTDAPRDEEGGA